MSLLAVVLWFTLLQALTPVPRQAINQPAKSPDAVQTQTKTDQKQPTTLPFKEQKQEGPDTDNQHGSEPTAESEPRHVIVDSVPAINASKDTWDKVYIVLTGFLGVIGGLTMIAIWYQAFQNKRATETALLTVRLQFRPRLVVRRISLEYGSLEVGGKPAIIHYTVANTGGTDATITRIHGSVDFESVSGFTGSGPAQRPLTPPSYSQNLDSKESIVLKAGEDRELTLPLEQALFDKVKFLQMSSGNFVTNPQLVGIIGIRADIQYSDGAGIVRKTGIWRSLDIETMRFNPVEDREYEYQD